MDLTLPEKKKQELSNNNEGYVARCIVEISANAASLHTAKLIRDDLKACEKGQHYECCYFVPASLIDELDNAITELEGK